MKNTKPILESIYIKLLLSLVLVLVISQFVISKTSPKPTWEWTIPKGINYEKTFTKNDVQIGNTATVIITFPSSGIVSINRMWADDQVVSIYLGNRNITDQFNLSVPFGESVISLNNGVAFPVSNQQQLNIQIKNTNSDTIGLFINFDYE